VLVADVEIALVRRVLVDARKLQCEVAELYGVSLREALDVPLTEFVGRGANLRQEDIVASLVEVLRLLDDLTVSLGLDLLLGRRRRLIGHHLLLRLRWLRLLSWLDHARCGQHSPTPLLLFRGRRGRLLLGRRRRGTALRCRRRLGRRRSRWLRRGRSRRRWRRGAALLSQRRRARRRQQDERRR